MFGQWLEILIISVIKKLSYQAELQMHVRLGIQTAFVFSFSDNVY